MEQRLAEVTFNPPAIWAVTANSRKQRYIFSADASASGFGMQTAFQITPLENERQNPVQFKPFTADCYETIKQRERRKERSCKETSKCSRPVEDIDIGWQTGGADIMPVSRIEPEPGDMRGAYEQGLRKSESPFDNSGDDLEIIEPLDLLIESWDVAFPELASLLEPSLSPDKSMGAAVRLSGSLGSPVPQRIATLPSASYASDGARIPVRDAICFSGEDGETSSPREDSPVCPTSCAASTDGHNFVRADDALAQHSGSEADPVVSVVPDRSGYDGMLVTTHTADIDNVDDGSVGPQAPKSSDTTPLCSNQRRNARRKWTPDDDSLLQHLRSTAGLPWARIARYFPHTSHAVLRSRFTKSSAVAADRKKNFTQPKRGRGRPRKREHPSAGMEHDQERRIGSQRRPNRTRANLSRPSTALPRDSDSGPLAASPPVGASLPSSSRQPIPGKRGRKRKVTPPFDPDAVVPKRSQNKPRWEVDRIVGMVEEDGELYYDVKWDITREPAKNLRGCADTAIAEFHLRHLL